MNRKSMKFYLFAILLLLSFTASVLAGDNQENVEFSYGFLIGSYEVIGRYPDTNETYTGKAIFRESQETLEVLRIINNKTIKGIGSIVFVTADEIKVLRVTFTENKKEYEATYLIETDLDNYGRLTGYIYIKAGGTKKPGVEALFSDHIYDE